jgi:hypothetical protein
MNTDEEVTRDTIVKLKMELSNQLTKLCDEVGNNMNAGVKVETTDENEIVPEGVVQQEIMVR